MCGVGGEKEREREREGNTSTFRMWSSGQCRRFGVLPLINECVRSPDYRGLTSDGLCSVRLDCRAPYMGLIRGGMILVVHPSAPFLPQQHLDGILQI